MNALRKTLSLLLVVALCGPCAMADDDVRIGVKAGTLGLGMEAAWQPLPWFDVRGGLNGYNYDETGSQAGINYDATLALQTLYVTANFHAPVSPLRFTAGLFANGNELKMVSVEGGPVNIGGNVYTAAEAGTLRSRTSFDGASPYAGVGFDFGLPGNAGLNLDVGVLLQGDPEVTLHADGTLADDPEFMAALEEERSQLAGEVDKLKVYPVLSLVLTFSFF